MSAAAPPACVLRGHTGSVQCLAFDPAAPAHLASASDNELLVTDCALPSSPAPLFCATNAELGLAHPVQALCWGRKGALYLGSGAHVLRVAVPGSAAGAWAGPPPLPEVLATCSDDVSALAVHATAPLLAACDDEGCVTLIHLDAAAGAAVLRRPGHASLATGVAFCAAPPGCAGLVSAGCDQRLLVWDAPGGGAGEARALPLLAESLPDLLLLQALEGGGQGEEGLGMGVNPPHILALALGPPPPHPAAPALLAAALGDGAVLACALSWQRGGRGGGGALRPSLAVPWVERSSLSPACALATVPLGGGSSGGAEGAPPPPARSLLVSASNSACLRAWDWAALGAAPGPPAPLAAWAHSGAGEGARRRKINWMAGSPCAGGLLAVADTGRRITLYLLAGLGEGAPAPPAGAPRQ